MNNNRKLNEMQKSNLLLYFNNYSSNILLFCKCSSNMIYNLNTHYGKIDLTWAILRQMTDELTRADVEGIILTHKLNTITNG